MVGIADFCSVGEESLFAFYMLQSFFYSLPEWEDGTNSLMKTELIIPFGTESRFGVKIYLRLLIDSIEYTILVLEKILEKLYIVLRNY